MRLTELDKLITLWDYQGLNVKITRCSVRDGFLPLGYHCELGVPALLEENISEVACGHQGHLSNQREFINGVFRSSKVCMDFDRNGRFVRRTAGR